MRVRGEGTPSSLLKQNKDVLSDRSIYFSYSSKGIRIPFPKSLRRKRISLSVTSVMGISTAPRQSSTRVLRSSRNRSGSSYGGGYRNAFTQYLDLEAREWAAAAPTTTAIPFLPNERVTARADL